MNAGLKPAAAAECVTTASNVTVTGSVEFTAPLCADHPDQAATKVPTPGRRIAQRA
jgi:hypothetical protein